MVSPVLQQAILNNRVPDLLGAFDIGRGEQRQQKTRELSGQALQSGGGDALKELQGVNPEVAMAIGESIRAKSALDINDFIRDARIGKNLLDTGDQQGFLSFARQRSNVLRAQGRDTSQTDRFIDLVNSGQVGTAQQELNAFAESIEGARSVSPGQRGETRTVRRDDGSLVSVTDVFNPNTNEIQQVESPIEGELVSRFTGETGSELRAGRTQQAIDTKAGVLQEQIKAEPELAEKKELASGRARLTRKVIEDNFTAIQGIDANIRNINRAIDAVDEGAGTGPLERFFPSISAASVKLDQIQKELGLDVVGNTTFGALSAGELDLALKVALPDNLNEKELRKFLIDKRKAQQKLSDYYKSTIRFLDGGGTVAELIASKGSTKKGSTNKTIKVDF
jgi:hypothetical protein